MASASRESSPSKKTLEELEQQHRHLCCDVQEAKQKIKPSHSFDVRYWTSAAEASAMTEKIYYADVKLSIRRWQEETNEPNTIGWWNTPEAHLVMDKVKAAYFEKPPEEITEWEKVEPKNYKWRIIDADVLDASIELLLDGNTNTALLRGLDERPLHFKNDGRALWVNLIPALQHNFNNSKHSVTGRSTNEVVYGFKPRSTLSLLGIPDKVPDYEIHRQMYQRDAETAIDFAAADAKIRYDSKHNPIQYNVGDEVLLRLHRGYNLPGKPPPTKEYVQDRQTDTLINIVTSYIVITMFIVILTVAYGTPLATPH
ncbi:hypothetical protein F4777DRAFT_575789 [Nemania sp. FL0916]|nr:hypothetical protein F4777DRAFT_575789 [Nemania sp. FL0916]